MKDILKKVKNKKQIVMIALLLLIPVIGGTIAYLRSITVFDNEFMASAYDVSIEEEFYNDWGTKKVKIINKDSIPVVLRVSYDESWVRETCKKYEESISSSDLSQTNQGRIAFVRTCVEYGSPLHLSNKIDGQELAIKEWTDIWKNDFVKGNDGWYYYKKVLDSNTSIQILNSVNKNSSLFNDNNQSLGEELMSLDDEEITPRASDDSVGLSIIGKYNNSDYQLSFNYEAVQADSKAIKELWNKETAIIDGNIDWKDI